MNTASERKYVWRNRLIAVLLVLFCQTFAHAEDVTSLLNRTTRQVSSFLEQVSDVRCTERVSQVKFNARNTRPEIEYDSTYDYLILLQGTGDDLLLNESRLEDKNDKPSKRNSPLLITNGFSTLFLIFHPYYRNSFRFEALPADVIGGEQFSRLRFTHIPGTRTPAALAVRGREYPLELAGIAWIDTATGMIARIETSLANDMQDAGLRSLKAEVDYAPMQLPGWDRAYRFPSVATVEVESLRQHWRNVHRFTNYQRFMVDTQTTIADASGNNAAAFGEGSSLPNKTATVPDTGKRSHKKP